MVFQKNLFITLSIVTIITLHQSNAMESETVTTSEEEITVVIPKFKEDVELDFQIYRLLLEATKNNPQWYIPEIIDIIITNLCDITQSYGTYGSCLDHPEDFIKFIQGCLNKSICPDSIVNILKMRLSHGDKSLSEFRDNYGLTVLHLMDKIQPKYYLDCIQIICLIAGDQAWDLIKKENSNGYTLFHSSFRNLSIKCVNKLLGFAPNDEELWKLICIKTQPYKETVFYRLLHLPDIELNIIKKLLTSAPSPKDAWTLINAQNYYDGNTALRSKLLNDTIRDLLESYRPANL